MSSTEKELLSNVTTLFSINNCALLGIYEFTVSPWDAFTSKIFRQVDASTTQEQRIWTGDNNRFFGFISVNPANDNVIELSIHPLGEDPVFFTFSKEDLTL